MSSVIAAFTSFASLHVAASCDGFPFPVVVPEECSESDFIYVDRVLVEGDTAGVQTIDNGIPQKLVEVAFDHFAAFGWGWGDDFDLRQTVPATCTAVCSVEIHSLPGCINQQASIRLRVARDGGAYSDLTESERTAEFNKYSTIEEVSTIAVVNDFFPDINPDFGVAFFDVSFQCAANTSGSGRGLSCTTAEVSHSALSVTCVLPRVGYLHDPSQ